MQHEKEILCRYRLERAKRAVNILDGFDASKYSSVIAHFNQYYVHTGEFDRGIYKIIDGAYRIRKNATIVISFWPQKKNLLFR